jgi:hypothetical protein
MRTYKKHPDESTILDISKRYTKAFTVVNEILDDYLSSQPKLQKQLRNQYKQLENMPHIMDKYLEYRSDDMLISLTMSSEQHIKRIRRQFGDQLSSSTNEILSYWQEEPFMWMAFMVDTQYDQGIFAITDIFLSTTDMLKSNLLPEILSTPQNRGLIYYATLVPTPMGLLQLGPIMATHLHPEDIAFALTQAAPKGVRSYDNPLLEEEAVFHQFGAFHLIDVHTEDPDIAFDGFLMRWCWSIHHVSKERMAGLIELESFCETTTRGSLTEYRMIDLPSDKRDMILEDEVFAALLREDDEGMSPFTILQPRCIIDRETGDILLNALSIESYNLMRPLLNEYADIDVGHRWIEEFLPSVTFDEDVLYEDMDHVHLKLISTFHRYYKQTQLPWKRFTDAFDENLSASERPSSAEMNNLNQLLSRMKDAQNLGIDPDIKGLSQEFDIPQEEVEQIERSLEKMLSKYEAPQVILDLVHDNPLPHLKDIPPNTRSNMRSPIFESSLFRVAQEDDGEIVHLFAQLATDEISRKAEQRDFEQLIDDLFYDYYGEPYSELMMNLTLFILLKEAHEWISVRSIAALMLKSFHTILLSRVEDIDEFIKDLSTFFLRVMCPAGLCEVTQRPKGEIRREGRFTVRTTRLFHKLVAFRDS